MARFFGKNLPCGYVLQAKRIFAALSAEENHMKKLAKKISGTGDDGGNDDRLRRCDHAGRTERNVV